jgi:hypothetical protein
LKVVSFQCDWFDPINNTRVDDFGMVEDKHKLCYSRSNLLLAHQSQRLYYLSYPHPSLNKWWVIYKVNPEMHTRRYDEYVEGHKDDDIYLEEIKVDQNFTLSDGGGIVELGTDDDNCWMKKQVLQTNAFENQSVFLKDKKDVNDLMHGSRKQILMLMTFDM